MGDENPSRESGGLAAWPGPPRGLEKAVESGKQLRGEGGPRRGPPTRPRLPDPGGCRSSVCAKPLTASGWPCVLVARIQEPCAGLECMPARGRPLLPAPAFGGPSSRPGPRFQAIYAGGGAWGLLPWMVGGPPGAAGRGATGVPWATSPEEGNEAGRVGVRASTL